MLDLFPVAHDPGGKSTFLMPEDQHGDAGFCGANEEYRLWLERWWEPGTDKDPYALLCGTNPSTAHKALNDPTIGREVGFTDRWGFRHLLKVNICDYRATDPKALLKPGVIPRSPDNLTNIREWAADAALVVMCSGAMHKSLLPMYRETVAALRKDGRELFCLGLTAAGLPKHPLYLKSDTPLMRLP